MAEQEKKEMIMEQGKEKVQQADQKDVLVFNRPYVFEGTEYKEVDLSGIRNLTIMDAIQAQKDLINQRELAAAILMETTTAFARIIAAKATGLPIEFFKLMPRGRNNELVKTVQSYFNVEQKTENHVLKFENPYTFEGELYTEVNLCAIADLNSMNESAAENRMAVMGFAITETKTNYYYSCVLASMATNKPEAFFTGLPLCETLKLKNAVNDPDFFE